MFCARRARLQSFASSPIGTGPAYYELFLERKQISLPVIVTANTSVTKDPACPSSVGSNMGVRVDYPESIVQNVSHSSDVQFQLVGPGVF